MKSLVRAIQFIQFQNQLVANPDKVKSDKLFFDVTHSLSPHCPPTFNGAKLLCMNATPTK